MAEEAGPAVRPMPATKEVLDQEYAKHLAEYWYGTYGEQQASNIPPSACTRQHQPLFAPGPHAFLL